MGKLIQNKNIRKILWVLPIFLISLVYIVDPRLFTSPPLRSDDWNQIVWPIVFTRIPLFDITSRRPLLMSLLALLSPLFGLQIQWYYFLNWLLLFFSGVIFYQIVRQAFPRYSWLALPTALIFMVYPVNYARTWLTVINNTFALFLALSSILLIVLYRRSGKLIHLIFANLLFLISLGTYEAAFGLVIFVAIVLIFFPGESGKKRRFAYLSIIIVGAFFVLWRTVLQPGWFDLQDQYLVNLETSINIILSRYGTGFFIFLFNWIGPLLLAFGEYKYWVFLGIVILTMTVILAFIPGSLKAAKRNPDFPYEDRVRQERSLLRIGLVGFLAWAAGYIPVIMLWGPNFYGDASRVNFSSIPGGALALAALIAAVITFFTTRKERIERIMLLVLIPMVLLGAVYQVHAQNQRVEVWEQNKTFWQAMFDQIPNLESNTKLVIVIPGYEKLGPFELLPFRGDWEAEAALDVLYNNPDLFAEYYYLDNPSLDDNWVPTDSNFSRYIFVFYQPEDGSVRIIEDPGAALNLSLLVDGYDPESRIIRSLGRTEKFRWLVD